ncbi:MAG: flippase-like domain-containing protein [Bacteroidia bacterium]|nr:flippase-like domain-containing protein [Bacteroidia bacterium]
MIDNPQVSKSSNKEASYKRFYPYLKWVISIVSLLFFGYQWTQLDAGVWDEILATAQHSIGWVILVLLLALINWNAEAAKLRVLLRSEIRLSPLRSFLIVLGGMAISNFTPARTGEYVGRGLLLKKLHPIKVIIATITGNLAQVILTYLLGLIAFFSFLLFTDKGSDWIDDTSKIGVAIGLLVLIILIVVYAKQILSKVKNVLPKKIQKTLNLVKRYNKALFLRVLQLAFVRYLAFSIQFFLLLQIFGDFALPWTSLTLIPVAYLLQSLVPVPAVSDVGVRVIVSQLLFGSLLLDSSILQAVTCLWFINLILPGIFGALYLLFSTFQNK